MQDRTRRQYVPEPNRNDIGAQATLFGRLLASPVVIYILVELCSAQLRIMTMLNRCRREISHYSWPILIREPCASPETHGFVL